MGVKLSLMFILIAGIFLISFVNAQTYFMLCSDENCDNQDTFYINEPAYLRAYNVNVQGYLTDPNGTERTLNFANNAVSLPTNFLGEYSIELIETNSECNLSYFNLSYDYWYNESFYYPDCNVSSFSYSVYEPERECGNYSVYYSGEEYSRNVFSLSELAGGNISLRGSGNAYVILTTPFRKEIDLGFTNNNEIQFNVKDIGDYYLEFLYVDNNSAYCSGELEFSVVRYGSVFVDINGDCPENRTMTEKGCVKNNACGNGLLEEGEECDDGNLANADGCNTLCKDECSNGIRNVNESKEDFGSYCGASDTSFCFNGIYDAGVEDWVDCGGYCELECSVLDIAVRDWHNDDASVYGVMSQLNEVYHPDFECPDGYTKTERGCAEDFDCPGWWFWEWDRTETGCIEPIECLPGYKVKNDFECEAMAASPEIDSCRVIDEPGNYVLTKDIANNALTGPCITIASENVILDCNGKSITTDDDVNVIYSNKARTTIKNCRITGANRRGQGISLHSANYSVISNIKTRLMRLGVRLVNSNNVLISNVTDIDSNSAGISLGSSSNNQLLNIFTSTQDSGIWMYESSNNTLENIYSNASSYWGGVTGINLIYGSKNNKIINAAIYGLLEGISIGTGSSNNSIQQSAICSNIRNDLRCSAGLTGNSGTGNKFTNVQACSDGWPRLNVDYALC